MTHLSFTTFHQITAIRPQLHTESLDLFAQRLKDPERVLAKTKVSTFYSFVRYKQGATRGTEGVADGTGVVLDFDFKEPLDGHLRGKPYIENFLSIHNIAQWIHFWHTTYSFTSTQPNFRVILPLAPDAFLAHNEWHELADRLRYGCGDHPALDQCGNVISQMYSSPCLPRDKEVATHYFHGFTKDGAFLSLSSLSPRPCVEDSDGPPHLTQSQKMLFLGQALHHIDPDIAYGDWIEIGMALKTEFGETTGLQMWDQWSRNGVKYKHQKDLNDHWKSFNRTTVEGGAIVKRAKSNHFDASGCLREILAAAPVQRKLPTASDHPPLKELPDEVFDNHFIFKDWGEFNYQGNIFDLSFSPLLMRLNEAFLANTLHRRHNMRLAAVLSVAGHLLPHVYGCPYPTPLYIFSLIPTGTGKGRFVKTIHSLFDAFHLNPHLGAKIGSLQGIIKKIIENNGIHYNIIDEVADYYRNIRRHGGDSRRAEVISLFKDIYGGEAPVIQDIIKKEESESIHRTSVSLFWSGPDDVFQLMGKDEFRGGLMNRVLSFVEDCHGDTGARDKTESLRLDTTQLFIPDFSDIAYRFPEEIVFSNDVMDFILGFEAKAREKMMHLGEQDLRGCILSRAGQNLKKLIVIGCDPHGGLSVDVARHMAGVLIHCYKNTSFCVNKHFEMTLEHRDILMIAERIHFLMQQYPTQRGLRFRDVYRSLQKIPRRRIEDGLKRLEIEGVISFEEMSNPRGLPSKIIRPTLRLNTYLTQSNNKENKRNE